LIEDALRAGDYGEVSALADLANQLAAIARRLPSDSVQEHAPTLVPAEPEPHRSRLNSDAAQVSDASVPGKVPGRQAARRTEYPRFERDGERLTKLGWSKKDRRVYEHRATKEVVAAVSKQLSERTTDGQFRMEDVVPFLSSDGSEIPSYQSYLTLAWLRHMGVVEKRGNDGYALLERSLDDERFEECWKATPIRSH